MHVPAQSLSFHSAQQEPALFVIKSAFQFLLSNQISGLSVAGGDVGGDAQQEGNTDRPCHDPGACARVHTCTRTCAHACMHARVYACARMLGGTVRYSACRHACVWHFHSGILCMRTVIPGGLEVWATYPLIRARGVDLLLLLLLLLLPLWLGACWQRRQVGEGEQWPQRGKQAH